MKHIATLRMLIEQHGNAATLAKKIGITRGHLSDVLAGKRAIGLDMAFRLEDACGTNGLRLLQHQLEHACDEYRKKQHSHKG